MELQTKRLIPRPWQVSDTEALYKYAPSVNVGPRGGWPCHTDVENSREIIKSVLSAPGTFAVILKETGEPIGNIGIITEKSDTRCIRMRENECEAGYRLGEPYRGMGLIPEALQELIRHAFEDLHLTTIWCGYYDGNHNSRRVQDECGFVYSHTEHDKPVPLINAVKTTHYTMLTADHW